VNEKPNGVLDPVRQLEHALDTGTATRAASDSRLEEARSAASALLSAARQDAAVAAAERRRVELAAAEDDVNEISRRGAETAGRVRIDARASCAAVVEAALALLLPAEDESEV
jgi:hypothetical protein